MCQVHRYPRVQCATRQVWGTAGLVLEYTTGEDGTMDLSIKVNGVVLTNVSYHDNGIHADYPTIGLTLIPSDLQSADMGISNDYRMGYLALRLSDSCYLRLQYPSPPKQECHMCHTPMYPGDLEYIGEHILTQYPTLVEHRYYYLCKACMGIHIDECESVLPARDTPIV
jgi:hypothetical protein